MPLRAPSRFAFGGAAIEVLAPSPDYVPVDEPKNNDSLAMRVTFGQRSLLLSGDVERGIEQEMLYTNELHPTDVLKVAHHGSRTSSTEEFLSAVHPAFAVISAGFENSYGHPHPSVIERLREHHAAILRTDLDGMITVRTDGRRINVETFNGLLGQR
jgi:competence protein ComEC